MSEARQLVIIEEAPHNAGPYSKLSVREEQVVRLTARGMSAKLVAEALDLSESTVNIYLTRARWRLGTKNKTETVAKWLEQESAGREGAQAEIARLKGEVERLTGERDRQYDYNAGQIAEDAAVRHAIPDEFILDPPDGGDVKTIESVRRMVEALATLRATNERYREALRWYSNKDNYKPRAGSLGDGLYPPETYYDEGSRARAALAQPVESTTTEEK